MTEPAVLYESDHQIAEITLNRPENRNSMTSDVLEGLREAVARARSEQELRCVIVTGRGKSFCAGADFKSQRQQETEAARFRAPNERTFEIYSPFLSLLEIEVPTIAAMQGHAIGGGLGLALVCDLRVANREARYGANFVRLGLHPGMATTYILPRLLGLPRATELLLTGRIISGTEAAEFGLIECRFDIKPPPKHIGWTEAIEVRFQGVQWLERRMARSEASGHTVSSAALPGGRV